MTERSVPMILSNWSWSREPIPSSSPEGPDQAQAGSLSTKLTRFFSAEIAQFRHFEKRCTNGSPPESFSVLPCVMIVYRNVRFTDQVGRRSVRQIACKRPAKLMGFESSPNIRVSRVEGPCTWKMRSPSPPLHEGTCTRPAHRLPLGETLSSPGLSGLAPHKRSC